MCKEMEVKRRKIKRMTRRRFTKWCKNYLKNAKLRQVVQEEENESDSWDNVSHVRAMAENSEKLSQKPLIDDDFESRRSHKQIARNTID